MAKSIIAGNNDAQIHLDHTRGGSDRESPEFSSDALQNVGKSSRKELWPMHFVIEPSPKISITQEYENLPKHPRESTEPEHPNTNQRIAHLPEVAECSSKSSLASGEAAAWPSIQLGPSWPSSFLVFPVFF